LTDLRLVNPRDGWPNDRAVAMASRADIVLDNTRVYATTNDAISDLQHVYATTARPRDVIKKIATPRAAAADLRAHAASGTATGILFGKESVGLSKEDVTLADTIISVPLNPDFSSINLAQAVLLVGYEWFQIADDTPPVRVLNEERPANKAELSHLFERIEMELDARGYFDPILQRKHVILQNMRNMFQRLGLMESDVRAFQGIIKGLTMKLKDHKSDSDKS
ncbi:MAG: TrmH family RNA methyltransferase, partial [Sneathiella sp.]